MRTVVRTRATVVWAVLVALTVAAWALGSSDGVGADQVPSSLAIFVVAVFKVRLVGLSFMELRTAPTSLRALLEGYCAILLSLLAGFYLLG
ncbi:cytochrome C oxidase subunit IV family protein [Nocardia sp. NPDC004123]